MKRPLTALACVCLSSALLRADFSYEQTSKMTGGMMASMMKIAGAFSKQAREPIVTKVLVKGNRMVNLGPGTAHVIDLDKQTITDINFQKKTYSVITFDQMRQALEQMSQKMKESPQADMSMNVSVKDTGQSKVINGLNTKEMILAFEIESTDRQSGQSGTMQVLSDMWLAPDVPGYEEVRAFHKKMAEKLAWSPGMMGGMFNRPDLAKGMGQLAKEASKLNGVPVMQVMRMGPKLTPEQQAEFAKAQQQSQSQQGQQQQQQQQQAQMPSAGDAAGEAAAGAATSRTGRLGGLAGGLGGLRGLGKKKQQEEQAPPPPPPQAQQRQAQSGPPPDASGALMEMTTELTGFSAGPVDASKFDLPAGFKQTESEMLKQSRK